MKAERFVKAYKIYKSSKRSIKAQKRDVLMPGKK
jgi:hypothetical protein